MGKKDLFLALDVIRAGAFILMMIGLAGLDSPSIVVPAAMVLICGAVIVVTIAMEKALIDYLHERRRYPKAHRKTNAEINVA